MHSKGPGWEIQTARSAGGSNAKSFEVPSPVKSKFSSTGTSLSAVAPFTSVSGG